jgi:hypothetical protein
MVAKIVGKGWSAFVREEPLLWDFEGTSEQGRLGGTAPVEQPNSS